jgi:hypothetical protein
VWSSVSLPACHSSRRFAQSSETPCRVTSGAKLERDDAKGTPAMRSYESAQLCQSTGVKGATSRSRATARQMSRPASKSALKLKLLFNTRGLPGALYSQRSQAVECLGAPPGIH